MKKYFLIAIISLLIIPAFVYAEAIQIDFLLAGMRDPLIDEPLNGGYVYSYEAGTVTSATLWLDRDKTTYANFPVELDAYGRAIVFGDDIYRFVVTNASGTTVWTSDGLEYQAQTSTSETYMTLVSGEWDGEGEPIINLEAADADGEAVIYEQLTGLEDDINAALASLSTDISALAFLDLTDTPVSYSGHPFDLVTVDSSSTALQFTSASEALSLAQFTSLGDTPGTYSGAGGKSVVVNAGATGLEFVSTSSSIPVGAVTLFAGATPPSGWVVCDGDTLNQTTYADLYTAIGNTWNTGGEPAGEFRIPDMRGIFAKGAGTNVHSGIVDGSGAAYVGSALGTYETDRLQGHDHTGYTLSPGGGSTGWPSGGDGLNLTTVGVTNDAAGSYGTARPANTTQPANACMHYIIKIE